MRKQSKKEFGWCYTWKSLIIVSNAFSIFFVCLHLFGKILYNRLFPVVAQLCVSISMCHIWAIASVVLYIKNYNLLLEKQIITKSKGKFWGGLLPLIMYEVINVCVLIFL